MDHVKELLADLGRRIQEEENKVRERIDRLSQYDSPGIEDEIREAWHQFRACIKPMQDEQQDILKQLATIEAAAVRSAYNL